MESENKPTLTLSKSVYEKLNELMQKSPSTVITSICALFIVIVLSLIIQSPVFTFLL